jgi:hypothetical protein
LIYQGLLEIAYLFVVVYYVMAVVQTDLTVENYLSLTGCFFSLFILVVRALKEWCTFLRKTERRVDWDDRVDLPDLPPVHTHDVVIFNYFSLSSSDSATPQTVDTPPVRLNSSVPSGSSDNAVMDAPLLDHLPTSPRSSRSTSWTASWTAAPAPHVKETEPPSPSMVRSFFRR